MRCLLRCPARARVVFSGEWQLILFSTNDPLLAGLQVLNNLIVGVFASSLLAYFLTQSSYVVRLTRDIVAFSNDLQDIGELYSNGCGADLCMELGGAHSIEKAEYREACFCFKTDKGSDFDMHDAYGEAVRLVSDLEREDRGRERVAEGLHDGVRRRGRGL